MVTPENVEAASDVLASQGFLHDIDTSWGIMSDGTVYKDSEFYEPGQGNFY